MAHRGNILSLYDNILEQSAYKQSGGEQSGGEQSGGEQSGGKPISESNNSKKSSTIDSYSPSDMSLSGQSSVSKLMKANRELKRDLDIAQDELKKVKKELEKANAMLTKYGK